MSRSAGSVTLFSRIDTCSLLGCYETMEINDDKRNHGGDIGHITDTQLQYLFLFC